MDTVQFPDPSSQQQIREYISRKYKNVGIDAIITVGSSPLKYVADVHDEVFPGVPVIFCFSNGAEQKLPPNRNFIGVENEIAPASTVAAALRLLPDTKHVLVVGGMAAFDRQQQEAIRQQLRIFRSRVDITFLTDLRVPALLDRLKHLPSDTVVLLTPLGKDADNKTYTSSEIAPLVVAASNAPVFSMSDRFIGHGEVGGRISSALDQGDIAGKIALQISQGVTPQNIQAGKSSLRYVFDWHAIHRWGLHEEDLPAGSEVLNRELTFWQSFKWRIIAALSLIIVETGLVFGLLWQRAKRRKAELQLGIAYDGLRLAVESARSAAWELDLRSGRDGWFGDLETIFGIHADSYFGSLKRLLERIHDEDRERFSFTFMKAKDDKGHFDEEFRLIRADGSVGWVKAIGQFSYTKRGTAFRMLGMFIDISERKEREAKLHESQKQFAAIIDSAMDAIIAIDASSHILLFNSAAEKMFRCAAADAIGTHIERFIPPRFRAGHQNHIQRFCQTADAGRLMGARPLSAVRIGGEEFPIEASISGASTDGKRLFTVTVRDITERIRAEKAAQESEIRFELVANTAPVMIWMSGIDKLFTYFNQRWLAFTGRPIEAELGSGWTELVHEEDLNGCLRIYTQVFDKREPFTMQYRLRRYDGEYRWVSDVGVPRFGPDGAFIGYIGSCVDVTDQKLAEEALSQIGRKLIHAHEEERKWIARELHDDINQRVALLSFELDRWSQQISRSKNDFQIHVQRARERLAEISRDIQALSHRLHSSKLEYLGLVVAAKGFCSELADQHQVSIDFAHFDIPERLPEDVSLCFFRVLQEALRNAIQHSGGTRFNVELRGLEGEVRLTIADSGIGFECNEALRHRGLGLISMRERLQSANGNLLIESEPGHGTTISAHIPVAATEKTQSVPV